MQVFLWNFQKREATGIYAGIVLDTKNFVQQTGARTFEAAAFLRRAGADIEELNNCLLKPSIPYHCVLKWYLKQVVLKGLLFP